MQKCCLVKFSEIRRKTLVSESFFNKFAGCSSGTLSKKNPTQVLSCKFAKSFQNILFTLYLRANASVDYVLRIAKN